MIYRLMLFLVINFGALAIGGLFTSKGVPSDWYINLIKAPWNPPGWAFGFAWTAIMICFSIYMAYLWPVSENKNGLVVLFIFQWILNVAWNPIFFYYNNILLGLVIISGLTLLVAAFLIIYWSDLKFISVLILPYLLWLIVATSLNGYIYLNN